MSTIKISNLPRDISQSEVDDLFFKYGKIIKISIKGPAATVEFEREDDAEDAKNGKDGYYYDGFTLSVTGYTKSEKSSRYKEKSRSQTRSRSRSRSNEKRNWSPPPRYSEKASYSDSFRGRGGSSYRGNYNNSYENNSRTTQNYVPRNTMNKYGQSTFNRVAKGPSKRTEFRILCKNMPITGSWQDLKDHFREAGDVSFSDVIKEDDETCVGIVEFISKADMTYAIEKLNDSEFKSHEGDKTVITIEQDYENEYENKSSRGFQIQQARYGEQRLGGYRGRGRGDYNNSSYHNDGYRGGYNKYENGASYRGRGSYHDGGSSYRGNSGYRGSYNRGGYHESSYRGRGYSGGNYRGRGGYNNSYKENDYDSYEEPTHFNENYRTRSRSPNSNRRESPDYTRGGR